MASLTFDVEWTQADDPDARFSNSAAELVIRIDDVPATRLYDTWSKTVTDRARLPLYPLAEWFAVNWWRLHAEAPLQSGNRPSADWRLAHDLGSVGCGFIWPRIRLASDGLSIFASARAVQNARWEPIRHLSTIGPTPMSPDIFGSAVDRLVTMVLQRLGELRIDAEPLATIWSDVLAERSDPDIAEWRMWEARLGYGADEAPDGVMHEIEQFSENVGADAATELAPLLRPDEAETIRRFYEIASASGVDAQMQEVSSVPGLDRLAPPWETGRKLAQYVRQFAGIGPGPLRNADLTDLLGAAIGVLDHQPSSAAEIGLGVRSPHETKTVLHFRKRNPAGRRFEAARFLADHYISSPEDKWLALTDRGTARQKKQRAFAAELLAPIDELREFLGDAISTERLEDAEDYFGLSLLAIQSHLANHGLLSPGDITA